MNVILCSKESENIIEEIFSDLDYEFVIYSSPGIELSNAIGSYREASVYFLQNHGLVVCDDDLSNAYELTHYINEESRKLLEKNKRDFPLSIIPDNADSPDYLFPDAVALSEENSNVNNYLYKGMVNIGLTPNFLNGEEIDKIKNMESEKYRRSLV